jgi:apolipoprotein N-acyltransferase
MTKRRFLLNSLKFSKRDFLAGVLIALCFSAFIYLSHFNIHIYLLNSILALTAFYYLLLSPQPTLLISGFFIGLLWFYWVGFSFIYVDMAWVVPFVALVFGVVYSFAFWLIGFTQKIYFRLPLLFLLSFYDPFYFNWFRPELLLVHSYFGVALWQYALILSSLAIFIYFKKHKLAPLAFILLFGAFDYSSANTQALPFNLTITQTDIKQERKWLPSELQTILQINFVEITQAIKDKKSLIILPESTLPLYLNYYPELQAKLKGLSMDIDIIIGSLYVENDKSYNATFYYHLGEEKIAKKMILVPFGEYIPLPKFIRKHINNLIFQGAEDYVPAKVPTDFDINGTKVRSAICYEATCESFYENGVSYMTAISNNAWFAPSIEPTLQKLLIKLYSKRHHVTVMHSINGSPSGIISY